LSLQLALRALDANDAALDFYCDTVRDRDRLFSNS